MRKSVVAAMLASLALISVPGAVLAHTKLVSSTPAANATVPAANARSINLVFNEKVIASTLKVELVMTGMPGMKDHAPMTVPFSSMMAKDGKSIMLMPKRALAAGTYQVSWSAAGADTHRMGSQFSFTVR
ncbi:MAG: copper homeostasis periplasmic binding protein CopC [Blastomonas fulva]|jgi:methionine-rich copper-binding protein CopC|uniref:copper homeostasis periplasmic binding protein CopC n=1 Tax=Blastomonas fulva TaxID=1550728 RepID=UPI0024E2447E|nr:copper homeostasis periplasmic binding protein CopC [Blastomonas fulva]MDK2759153.1 copper homeostasis periplasmic binding protein CopC [Blastomonas fulva]MDZ4135553.1 copper homeostasis periplasmic binding protein CopC [Paracoccaceae bacterium]MDZ4273665.1 copper homeostasis periplasmic binding protein CopC [Erythrobacter sp.]